MNLAVDVVLLEVRGGRYLLFVNKNIVHKQAKEDLEEEDKTNKGRLSTDLNFEGGNKLVSSGRHLTEILRPKEI